MRLDLVKVARMQGVPDGYAPSALFYRKHGLFSEKVVIGWFFSYTAAGNPRGNWRQAVAKLGFKMYGDHYHGNLMRVAADVRRVALEIGRPLHVPPRSVYKRLGRWDPNTVYHHLGVETWTQVAAKLNLKPNNKFGFRKITKEQAKELVRRYNARTKRGDVRALEKEFGITGTQIRRIALRSPTPEQQDDYLARLRPKAEPRRAA
jgi:hypothetical protein